ncbi:anaerobic ribonucleotide reductase-activating protein [compost metagenome]
MYYGNIKTCDVANGIGVRVSLFVSGCTHHCKGCFNPETWSFDYGAPFTVATENRLLEELGKSYINGLTLLGGEPFEPDNQRALLPFVLRVKEKFPDKSIWAFSGYTWEKLTGESRARCEVTDRLLSLVDVLVDGRFVEARKDISLRFRGSDNQRILDVPSSLTAGAPILWHGETAISSSYA